MGHLSEHTESRGVHEITAVGAADIHFLIIAGAHHVAKGRRRIRQMQGCGKVVAGAGGQDGQGDAAAGTHQAVQDLVDGAVAAAGDDEITVLRSQCRRRFRGVAPPFGAGDRDAFGRAVQQQTAGDQLQLLLDGALAGVGVDDDRYLHLTKPLFEKPLRADNSDVIIL